MGIQPVSAVGREDQDQTEGRYNDLLAQSLRKQEESRTTLTEMIREAKEKADAQREKFKLAKAARVRESRTRHAGENQRGDYIDVGKAALPVADHGGCEIENSGGHAAAVHQVARKDKERYGQQCLAVYAIKHLLQGEGDKIPAPRCREKEDGGHNQGVSYVDAQHNKEKP